MPSSNRSSAISNAGDFTQLIQAGNLIFNLNKKAERKFGLSLIQLQLLQHILHHPGCSPNTLALNLQLHPSTLTPSIVRLERKRFLLVLTHPKDSRKKLILITRTGKNAVDSMNKQLANWSLSLKRLQDPLKTLIHSLLNDL